MNKEQRKGSKFKTLGCQVRQNDLMTLMEMASLDPSTVMQTFDAMTEEEAIEKLRIALDQIFQNCGQIAQELGIKFEAQKHGELNT